MRLLLVGLALALSSMGVLAAEKCVGPNGKIIYTDMPCPVNSTKAGTVKAAPEPDYVSAARVRNDLADGIDRINAREDQEAVERARIARQREIEEERAQRAAMERRRTEAIERMAAESARRNNEIQTWSPPPRQCSRGRC